MLSRASHPQHRQGTDHYNIRPSIKRKEPSVKHACRYDAESDSLTRIHAPIKDESKYHLTPLMNKALLSHCRGVSPTASTTSSPRLHCCHMDTRSGTSAICSHCLRKRTERVSFLCLSFLPTRSKRRPCISPYDHAEWLPAIGRY